jgi:hypothetical protein
MQRLIGKVLDEEELLEQIEREEDLATLGSAGECMCVIVVVWRGALRCAVLSVDVHGASGCIGFLRSLRPWCSAC